MICNILTNLTTPLIFFDYSYIYNKSNNRLKISTKFKFKLKPRIYLICRIQATVFKASTGPKISKLPLRPHLVCVLTCGHVALFLSTRVMTTGEPMNFSRHYTTDDNGCLSCHFHGFLFPFESETIPFLFSYENEITGYTPSVIKNSSTLGSWLEKTTHYSVHRVKF